MELDQVEGGTKQINYKIFEMATKLCILYILLKKFLKSLTLQGSWSSLKGPFVLGHFLKRPSAKGIGGHNCQRNVEGQGIVEHCWICPRYVLDMSQICPRYVPDMFKVCPRYVPDLSQNILLFSHPQREFGSLGHPQSQADKLPTYQPTNPIPEYRAFQICTMIGCTGKNWKIWSSAIQIIMSISASFIAS